ncbi:alkyl hydroperoxide reductase [Pseudoalteromonas sp. NBT06-2]|uniref:peroxiredoxin family protein n=1 Tax=Pseudoalteromonas sp. NBT06-2 TaxID=2025950 RepID=UPI000BA6C60F|nr:TlpA disulfide reductase family protein [Pseudoalteromonas sp. NBT06-2]PAJ73198.1 alkyl hydroperoxide reductase [Pseudoalteromonas sp. NBT06-2]
MTYNTSAEQAPEFTLKTELGETVSLSDYKGKPLILHFWATWCPYCKKLQPGLDTLYTKYKTQGLEVLAVSLWEDQDATPQAELNSRGWHFKTVINGDEIHKQFAVVGTPTTFFISKTGEIVYKTSDSDPHSPNLEKAVKMIVK